MEVHTLLSDVSYDLERGVYTNFPVLLVRFRKLVKRLDYMNRVINPDPLTPVEMKLLIENGYITSQDIYNQHKKVK